MFIENIIESLPDDKCLCLAKHLGIEENRAFIAKKKLINVLGSEAYLIKTVGTYIEEFRDLLRAMFPHHGRGPCPERRKTLLPLLVNRGLIFYTNKANCEIYIPFEYYFVSDFFSPSCYSLLYALQGYEESVLEQIGTRLNIQNSLPYKINLCRKIYHVITRSLPRLQEALSPKEQRVIEAIYYSRSDTFWKETFSANLNNVTDRDKIYVKDLFQKAKGDSPLYSLLLKGLLIPVADRARLFVEELAVPSEFEEPLFRRYREREKQIVTDLRSRYFFPKSGEQEYTRPFLKDFRTALLAITGLDVRSTTTKKIYYKDLRRLLDLYGWSEEYFDLLWEFQKAHKVLDVHPILRTFRFSKKGESFFRLSDEEKEEKLFHFFLRHPCCSMELKALFLEEWRKCYPSYVDVRFFLELSSKVASDFPRLLEKESAPADQIFPKLFSLFFSMGFGSSPHALPLGAGPRVLGLSERGFYLSASKRPLPSEENPTSPIYVAPRRFGEDLFSLPVSLSLDQWEMILKSADVTSVGDDILFRLNPEKIDLLLDGELPMRELLDKFQELFMSACICPVLERFSQQEA